MNGLLNLFANIILFGLLLWVVNTFIPMPGSVRSLLGVLVIVILIVYILQFFGIIQTLIPMYKILR